MQLLFPVYIFYQFKRFWAHVLWGQPGTGGRELKRCLGEEIINTRIGLDKGSVSSLYGVCSVYFYLFKFLIISFFPCLFILLHVFLYC